MTNCAATRLSHSRIGKPEALNVAKAADVIPGYYRRSGVTPDEKVVLPLTPLIENDPNFNQDDYFAFLLESDEDDLYALPWNSSVPVMFYDRDAFDAAGLTYPEIGWTQDDFLAAAKALTKRSGDEVEQWGYVATWLGSAPFLSTILDEPIVDLEAEPQKADFNRPDVAAAIQEMADLFTLHEVLPWLDEYKPFDPDEDTQSFAQPEQYNLIEQGKAALWNETLSDLEWRGQGRNIGVATLPTVDGKLYSSGLWTTEFAISKGTQNPDAAWTLIDFITRQPPVGFGADTRIPARRSVAEASGFWDNLDEEHRPVVEFTLDNVEQIDYERTIGAALGALAEMIEDGVSAETALANAQEKFEESAQEQAANNDEDEDESVTDFSVEVEPVEATNPNASTIVFISDWGLIDAHRDLVDQFQIEHPDIEIDMRLPDYGPDDNEMAQVMDSADCFHSYASTLDEEARDFVLPMDAFFDADSSIDKDDFFASSLTSVTHQGELYGVPAYIPAMLLAYNKAVFDDAGVAYPDNDWTIDDFLAIAQAISEGEGEQRRYGYYEMYGVGIYLGLSQFEVDIIDELEDPPNIDFAKVAQPLRWYADLVALYDVQPASPNNNDPGSWSQRQELFTELVNDNRLGMWIDIGQDDFIESLIEVENIGYVVVPRSPSGKVVNSARGIPAYFIRAETEHRAACWEWIKFLGTQPSAVAGLPARIETAALPDFVNTVGEEKATAYRAALDNTSDTEFFADMEEWMFPAIQWIDNVYYAVINDGAQLDAELSDAEQKFTEYRNCVIANDAFDERDDFNVCLREVDPDLADRFGG